MPVATTEPVLEVIAKLLFARLQNLTAGRSGSTQFELKASEVIRPRRLGQDWTPKHLLIVLTQGDSEDGEMKPGNPPSVEYFQTFNIDCFVMPSEKDMYSVDEYKNVAAADIVRAVTIDGAASWHVFNDADGNPQSINARFSPLEDLPADGGADGVRKALTVQYRTDETSPYVVRI